MAICPKCQEKSADVLDPCPSGDGYYCIEEDDYFSHSNDRLLGRKISDRYIVQSVLGRGSMSQVYKAHQGQVDRSVALKIFQPETILGHQRGKQTTDGEREEAERRFVQEAKVLGKLSHPNCVTVYDFGVEEGHGVLYMAMEHVAGVSLRTAIRRGLKLDAIIELSRQVLEALREAHSLDIVHRDLKPENILLSFRYSSDEQVVKVLDFGIAKLLRKDTDHGRGKLFGTPAYMSPEQCRGEVDTIGPMADVYAYGCILYEMVCGKLPFAADTPQEMVRQHLREPIPEVVPRANLDVPDGLVAFIETCLDKEPTNRYATAHEALAELQKAMSDADVPFGSGLTVRTDGEVHRSLPDQSRQVKVPKDGLSGIDIDPFGEEESEEGSSGVDPSSLLDGLEELDLEEGEGPEEVPPTVITDAPSSKVGAGQEAEVSAAAQTSREGEPPTIDHEEGDQPSVGDTMAGGGIVGGVKGKIAERLSEVDRQTVAVISVLLVLLLFCVVVFYYIVSTMTPAT